MSNKYDHGEGRLLYHKRDNRDIFFVFVFPMLEERQDSDGNTWYLIQTGFGQRGWIPDWLCEKADKQTTVYISERGRLLDPEIDEDLYIRALLMDEYTLKF